MLNTRNRYGRRKTQGGWIGVAIGAASAIGSAFISKKGGEDANVASANEARLNRQFQERMSRTAHQREVKDLRKAGLNPILSAGGTGATTPSGSMATQQDVLTPAVTTALSTRRLTQELRNMKAQEKQTQAMEALTKNQKEMTVSSMRELESRSHKNRAEEWESISRRNKIDAETIGVSAENVGREVEADLYESTYGWLLKMAQKMGLNVSSASALRRRRKK